MSLSLAGSAAELNRPNNFRSWANSSVRGLPSATAITSGPPGQYVGNFVVAAQPGDDLRLDVADQPVDLRVIRLQVPVMYRLVMHDPVAQLDHCLKAVAEGLAIPVIAGNALYSSVPRGSGDSAGSGETPRTRTTTLPRCRPRNTVERAFVA